MRCLPARAIEFRPQPVDFLECIGRPVRRRTGSLKLDDARRHQFDPRFQLGNGYRRRFRSVLGSQLTGVSFYESVLDDHFCTPSGFQGDGFDDELERLSIRAGFDF